MSERGGQIEADAQVRAGEPLEGVVSWQLEAAPARAELRLVWWTRGAGLPDRRVVDAADVAGLPVAAAAHAGEGPYRGVAAEAEPVALRARDARRFRLRAPPSPPSFVGTLIELQWGLELVIDGAAPVVHALAIGPGGTAIRLP